eukprot:1640416-Rhodomonas_salina.1
MDRFASRTSRVGRFVLTRVVRVVRSVRGVSLRLLCSPRRCRPRRPERYPGPTCSTLGPRP